MALSTRLLAAIDFVVGARPSAEAVLAAPLGPVGAMIALGLLNTALAYFLSSA